MGAISEYDGLAMPAGAGSATLQQLFQDAVQMRYVVERHARELENRVRTLRADLEEARQKRCWLCRIKWWLEGK